MADMRIAMGMKEIQGRVPQVEQKRAVTDVAGKRYLNLQLCFSVKKRKAAGTKKKLKYNREDTSNG